jgi:tetratricopeptide (TPR) repeat protein
MEYVGRSMKNLICIVIWLLAAGFRGRAQEVQPPTALDRAFNRIYNFDFPGAYAILDAEQRAHPDNPLVYSVRSAAYLFFELDRMKILEMDFFADDDKVTDRKRVKPDPAARAELFKMTEEARKRAQARLAANPQDREAMFALLMSTAVETDYVGIVEKRYFRTYSLSKEAQQYARRLLALNPPFCDANMTLGSVEYVVSNLNFFFRLFVHFDQIEGSKQKAIENLNKVIACGRFYPPFAKILLSVIYLREKQQEKALKLLQELARDYPENLLIKSEVGRVLAKIAITPRKKY